MRSGGTTWDRAARVRELVRRAYGPSVFCSTLAIGFWSLGTHVGLPLRIVRGSANGLNQDDTHETVELWLSDEHRWAVSDPTFDGYWSLGRTGRPIAIATLQKAIRTPATKRRLFWHSAHTRHSLRPSGYYVDPTLLFRYVEYGLTRGGSPEATALAARADEAWTAWHVYVPRTPVVFETLPPSARVAVRDILRDGVGSAAGRRAPLAPAYARKLLTTRRIGAGTTTLQIPPTPLPVVVTVASTTGTWTLTPKNGDPIPLAATIRGRVSPIAFEQSGSALRRNGPGLAAEVKVWAAPAFPRSQEL
ncbi:MAG: hypothetical protein QOE36_2708, partial [Gaiellaceae bacterium]|nr:hypothetical protein [Gaiellaceae bacterium]